MMFKKEPSGRGVYEVSSNKAVTVLKPIKTTRENFSN